MADNVDDSTKLHIQGTWMRSLEVQHLMIKTNREEITEEKGRKSLDPWGVIELSSQLCANYNYNLI